MSDLVRDLRYGVRLWGRQPLLTVAIVATLALGIGVNTAIFSMASSLLFKPLPFADADRLVHLTRIFPHGPTPNASPRQFLHWRRYAQSFEAITAYDWIASRVVLTGSLQPEWLTSYHVDASFFKVFSDPPHRGRYFSPEEDVPNGPLVVVLSHQLWQNRFGGDEDIVGQVIQLNRKDYEVIGIAPQRMTYPEGVEMWLPMQLDPASQELQALLTVTGKLNPGISRAVVEKQMDLAEQEYFQLYGNPNNEEGLRLPSLRHHLFSSTYFDFVVLALSVFSVLLIACANVANLQLARASARGQEIATRLALGATPKRLLRQLLTESVLLALLAGLLGLGVAHLSLGPLSAFLPEDLPRYHEFEISGQALLFQLLVALVVGVATGLAPGMTAARTSVTDAIKEGLVRVGQGRRNLLLRRALVIAEIALTTTTLVAALLLLRSYSTLMQQDPELRPEELLTVRVGLDSTAYARTDAWTRLCDQLMERVEALPGVQDVAVSTNIPMVDVPEQPFEIRGRDDPESSVGFGRYKGVSANYFDMTGMKILAGRGLERQDLQQASLVVVINERLKEKYWRDEDPIGQFITIGLPMLPHMADKAPRRIVGIVSDFHESGLRINVPAMMYVPIAQMPDPVAARWTQILPLGVTVRASIQPLSLAEPVTAEIKRLDAQLPVEDVLTLDRVLESSTTTLRGVRNLVGLFAVAAILLTAFGIYSVLAFLVLLRTREIGLRKALGADRQKVFALIMGQGMRDGLIGLGIGLFGGGVAGYLLRTKLEISPLDPLSFGTVAVLVFLLVAVSAGLPARRAARTNPATAIHHL